jgi:uncharacterized protein
MLIQFRVGNHRSLRDEQTFSLVASQRDDGPDSRVFQPRVLDEPLVAVAAIYGANASGKSNVLAALRFMKNAVRESQRSWEVDGTPQQPFLLSEKSREPSLYEAVFLVNGVRFRYGFLLSSSRVEEEWLFVWPSGEEVMWFEREQDSFNFGESLHGDNETIRGLTRPNSLFLSAAAQNNHPTLGSVFRFFRGWRFASRRRLTGVSLQHLSRALSVHGRPEAERDAILKMLRDADTGILDARVIEHDDMTARHGRPSLFFQHRGGENPNQWLPLAAESSGTIALLELAPLIIDTLNKGGVLFVDELESSLHPALAWKIVEIFGDRERNLRGSQLVFATHDTNLLGSIIEERPLRRDQIWFTEKDETGGTHLYPLTDFHPRQEENVERGYLQGRYGAIPYLGELIAAPAKKEP